MTPAQEERLARLEQWKDSTDGWLKTVAATQRDYDLKLDRFYVELGNMSVNMATLSGQVGTFIETVRTQGSLSRGEKFLFSLLGLALTGLGIAIGVAV